MSKFVVVMFPDEAKIAQAIRAIEDVHAKGSIKLYASAAIARNTDGKLSEQQITIAGLGGTAVAALLGALAGSPGGPLAVTIAATGGAIFGSSVDITNRSDQTELVDKISRELAAGKSAVVADVAEDGVRRFEALMESIGGTVVRN